MSKQVRAHQWYQESHAKIHDTAQAFDTGKPAEAAKPFHENADTMSADVTNTGGDIQKVVGVDWRGKAAQAMQAEYNKFFDDVDKYVQRMHDFGNKLPEVASPMQAAKNIPAPMSGDEESGVRQGLKLRGFEPNEIDAAVAKKREEDQDFARYQMTGQFSQPVVGDGASAGMDDAPPDGGGDTSGGIQAHGGGGGGGAAGGGAQGLSDLSKIGHGGDTKPAFDQGLGDQNGQSAGQGQGAGGGSGAGSGGGSPSGGSGGGAGSSLGGPGSGSDRNGLGSGSPYGGTTAASYHPPTGGTGSSTSGPGALRPGLGVPSLGGNSAGTNPAGVGAAGVRGGTAGVGGMGMAGAAGAHGRGGKDEDEGEHATPAFLINLDNGQELFYDDRKASPGVIGDWSEQERAEKLRLENEKKRYKSLGWDVKFD